MTAAVPRWEVGARVELPTRLPQAWRLLFDAVARAGLPLSGFAVEAGEGAESPPLLSFDPPALLALLAHRSTSAIVLGADAPSWRLSVPLAPGRLTGWFAGSAIDPLARPTVLLLAHLFDMNLVEWGLAGPAVSSLVAATPAARLDQPTALPALSWISYLSPDLAYPPDLAAGVDVAGVRRVRSHVGAAVLALRSLEDEPALVELRAISPGLLASWDRPPVDAYPEPDGDRLLLRDVSPGLARVQRQAASAALDEARRHGAPLPQGEVDPLGALREVDRVLARGGGALPGWLVESWGALAGEALLRAGGGRWRRRLDPRVPFPENLYVVLPGDVSFAPHYELTQFLTAAGPPPAEVVRERLSLSRRA